VFTYIKEFFEHSFTENDRTPISADNETRFKHYSIFLLLSIPLMLFYGFFNTFIDKHLWLSVFILLLAIGLFVGWLFVKSYGKDKLVYRINTLIYSVLVLYMLLLGGEGGAKILWMYTFPLISFFLLGKNEGLYWNVAIIFLAVLIFWNPLSLSIVYSYPSEFITRFIMTYMLISTISYWYEYYHYHYLIKIELKNKILRQEISKRKKEKKERIRVINELQSALNEVKELQGILPLCSYCKKIRDDSGYWEQVDVYINKNTAADISHGICPECIKQHFPNQYTSIYPDNE